MEHDRIADVLRDVLGAEFVTRYVVVACTVEDDGTEATNVVTSPALPAWMAHGMLSYEAGATRPRPFYEQSD